MTSNGVLTDDWPAAAKTPASREQPEVPAVRRRPAGLATASAAGATVVLWASAFVGIRFAGHDFSPGALALGRMAAASVVLSLVIGVLALRARRGHRCGSGAPSRGLPRGRTLGLVVGWGIAWFGAYNVALNAAERLVDAGTAALLVAIAPILVAVSAIAVLGERLTRRLGIGVAVAFLGVALISATGFTGHVDGAGVVLAVLAALLYAAAVLLQKRLLPRVEATTMTWLGALAGTAALLPWAPALLRELSVAPTGSLLGVLYLGVFPTVLGFLTWGYVISRWTAGRATAATYLIPPVTVLLSWAVLSEVPAPLALLGGALCLAGVVLATRR